MPNQPIILLTFANDEDAHLDMLKAESTAVYDALEDVQNEELVEVKREESATLDIIADRLNKYQDDISIFHYSGHASGQHLKLEDSTVNAGGLAKLIAAAPNIQLVILNGCASYGQVEELLNLGVKAVIATTTAIGDTKAKEFSEEFYDALGEYKTVKQAFKQAMAFLEAKYSTTDEEAAKPKKGLKLKRKSKDKKTDIPWGLYYEDETALEWRLNNNLKAKSLLRVGSSRYYQKLLQSRFQSVEIKNNILSHLKTKLSDKEIVFDDKSTPLETCLRLAAEHEFHDIFLIGENGRGKTASFIKVWENGLSSFDWKEPIPIFISLAEYDTSEHKKDFILNLIATNYLGKKRATNEDLNMVWEVLKHPHSEAPFKPVVYLLLDGLDEVTVDTIDLIGEIKNIVEEAKGTQIIISSQVEYVFTWLNKFHKVKTKNLTSKQIETYLKEAQVPVPTSQNLLDFIKTPMILSLYATSSNLTGQYMGDDRLEFRHSVSTYSDLVWNFTESIMAQKSQDISDEKFAYLKFMLRHFMPYIAFYMIQKAKHALTKEELIASIQEGAEYLYQKEFLDSFPFFIPSFRTFNIISKDWLGDLERFEVKTQFITKRLRMMTSEESEGKTYFYFTQQRYRDFFAAVHVYNDLKISKKCKKLPTSLSQQKFSTFNEVGQFVGELCGEHLNTADTLTVRRTWQETNETLLTSALNQARGKFDDIAHQNVAWNILTIWKKLRRHFADTDLSNLDLRDFGFEELPLRHFRKYPVHPAILQGSLLHENSFISQGHTKGVNAVAYSPDGKRILSASQDHTIKEWSVASGKCLCTFEGHTEVVKCLAYNADGTRALSGSDDKIILEWDLVEGKPSEKFEGHEGGITSVKYCKDGQTILSASLDKTVKHWEIKSGKLIETFDNFKSPVINLAIHPKGERFATATREKAFQEWSLKTGKSVKIYVGHQMPVECIAYNEAGCHLVSGSYDNLIKEWDTETTECVKTLKGHKAPVISLKYIPDGSGLISCGRDNLIKEWYLPEQECIRSLKIQGVSSVDYHISGRRFIGGSWNNMIYEYDTLSGKLLQTFEGYSNQVTSLAVSPNGKFLYSSSTDNTIRKWDIETNICVQTLEGHSDTVTCLAISPNGRYLLSGSDDKTIRLWKIASGDCINTYKGHTSDVQSVAFHPLGQRFVSASHDTTLKLWSIHDCEEILTFQADPKNDMANCVVFSSKGRMIASGHNDKLIKIWDVRNGELLKILGEEVDWHTLMVYDLKFSPDDKFILSASEDKTIKEWNVETGKCIRTFKAHSKPIESIDYNHNYTRIVSVSRDKKVKEWDLSTGACLQTLEGHRELVSSVVYATDGQHFYSGSMDSTIKIWATFTKEKKIKAPKEGIQKQKEIVHKHHKKVEDKKVNIQNDLKEDKKEGGLFQSLSKLTGRFTDTVKDVIIERKDNSEYTLVSASGLKIQGADFRNLHEDSYFSNDGTDLMRQYGAIFEKEDYERWIEMRRRLRKC